jgi:hydroxyethylthiazole kinase-like uncharacterized protein yjeF
MRAIEQAAIGSGAATGLELMERAGRAVVEAVFEEWPGLAADPGRALVLCGPGNNGGDGFVVARVLKDSGWDVLVLFAGRQDRLPPDAAENCRRWLELGPVAPLTEDKVRAAGHVDLVVDAIFGSGLARPLEGEVADAVSYMGGSGEEAEFLQDRTVSVDAPSGLCLDSGRVLGQGGHRVWEGRPLRAALTVTFESAKVGHFLGFGPELCGRLTVKDIGLSRWHGQAQPDQSSGRTSRIQQMTLAPSRRLRRRTDTQPAARARQRRHDELEQLEKPSHGGAHKYDSGHALVLSGGPARGGAARLAARAALRIGAGLVTLGCPPEAEAENAARLDAVMLRGVADAAALATLLEDKRITAVCLGPGLGVERAKAMLPVVLGWKKRTVIDADALTALAEAPELFAQLHWDCVLTPHGGEFARLFPDIAARLDEVPMTGPAYSKVDATREASARANCVVLYKGADTVISRRGGACTVSAAAYERAAPWLATAGAGDVLAGLILGLLARRRMPMEATEVAAWLHVEAARSFGPGLIAEDLAEELPKVFREIGL